MFIRVALELENLSFFPEISQGQLGGYRDRVISRPPTATRRATAAENFSPWKQHGAPPSICVSETEETREKNSLASWSHESADKNC